MKTENDYRQTPQGKWRFENPELYQKTVKLQTELWENGIAWHNPFSDECTPDFNCCENIGRETIMKFPAGQLAIFYPKN